jgi:hypothetical protein
MKGKFNIKDNQIKNIQTKKKILLERIRDIYFYNEDPASTSSFFLSLIIFLKKILS